MKQLSFVRQALAVCWFLFGFHLWFGCDGTASHAEVRLATIFADHMVVQRDRPLTFWGWGTPGEEIEVRLGDQAGQAQVATDGSWACEINALPMSREGLELVVRASNEIRVRDVLVGDVWLCSGQSNMEWGLGGCDAPEDIAQSNEPMIRHFGVEMNFAHTPKSEVRGRWSVATPQSTPGFTAVGYYFAKRVHAETGVPIGIVRSSVGGTNIECWMAQETLMNTPALEPYARMMRESLAQYQKDLATVIEEVEKWTLEARQQMLAGTEISMPPAIPEFPFGEKMFRPRCVTLHNGMIHPLKRLSLRGVLWYQGENNAGNAEDGKQYIEKKRAMVSDWRKWFSDPDLPFYFVQLAAWQSPTKDPAQADGWAYFRDAQRKALSIENTGMAVAIDIGDAQDIHPKNKYDVGERLARWALVHQYGKSIECSGPLFRQLTIDANRAVIEFDHVGQGLMVGRKNGRDPVVQAAGESLSRFAIAGEDRKWYWAEATIEGDKVVCTHPEVARPVAVRYGFSMNPEGANLYNRDGLPASPFTTE